MVMYICRLCLTKQSTETIQYEFSHFNTKKFQ